MKYDFCFPNGSNAYANRGTSTLVESPREANAIKGGQELPLSKYERSIMLFGVHVTLVPEEANSEYVLSLTECLAIIQEAWKAGRAQMSVGEYVDDSDTNSSEENGARDRVNILSIKDMVWEDDGAVAILFDHGDASAADPAIKDFGTMETQTVLIKENQGLAHAAHLLISTEDHVSSTGRARALLERVPNLGRSVALTFLNRILREEAAARNIEFRDPDTKKMKKCHPKFIMHNQLSDQLKEDLKSGRLNKVAFVSRKIPDTFEEHGRVVPKQRIVTCSIVNPPTGEGVRSFVERLKLWGKNNDFEEMHLQFTKDKEIKGKQHLSARLATDLDEAEDAVYSKLEPLQGFAHLEQSPEAVVIELKDRMKNLFAKEGLWK